LTFHNILNVGVFGFRQNTGNLDDFFLSKKHNDEINSQLDRQVETGDKNIKTFVICSKQDEVWDPTSQECISSTNSETGNENILEEPDLQVFFGELSNLVDVNLLREVDFGKYRQEHVPFQITSLSAEQMTFDLEFNDPGSITVYDKLAVTTNFQSFESNYRNGTIYEQFMTL